MLQQQIAVDTLKDAIRSASCFQIDPFVFLKIFVYWTEYLHTKTLACKDGLFPTIACYKHAIDELIEVYDEELFSGGIKDFELFDLFHDELPIIYKEFIIAYYDFDLNQISTYYEEKKPSRNYTYNELVTSWMEVVTYLNK